MKYRVEVKISIFPDAIDLVPEGSEVEDRGYVRVRPREFARLAEPKQAARKLSAITPNGDDQVWLRRLSDNGTSWPCPVLL